MLGKHATVSVINQGVCTIWMSLVLYPRGSFQRKTLQLIINPGSWGSHELGVRTPVVQYTYMYYGVALQRFKTGEVIEKKKYLKDASEKMAYASEFGWNEYISQRFVLPNLSSVFFQIVALDVALRFQVSLIYFNGFFPPVITKTKICTWYL